MRAAKNALDAELARIKQQFPSAEAVLVDGEPRQRIVETAIERNADLIVMGTHGRRGLSHVFLGSVAERIVRTSPVPVLTTGPAELAKGGGIAAFRHILVPTDFGEPAERALETASAFAAKFDAKLTIVHTSALAASAAYWPADEIRRNAETDLARALAKMRERLPRAESVLVHGDARELILEVARERNVDLIVMGTHGRRGLSRAFLGSVAERVVRTSPIPVLTVGARAQASDAKPPL